MWLGVYCRFTKSEETISLIQGALRAHLLIIWETETVSFSTVVKERCFSTNQRSRTTIVYIYMVFVYNRHCSVLHQSCSLMSFFPDQLKIHNLTTGSFTNFVSSLYSLCGFIHWFHSEIFWKFCFLRTSTYTVIYKRCKH